MRHVWVQVVRVAVLVGIGVALYTRAWWLLGATIIGGFVVHQLLLGRTIEPYREHVQESRHRTNPATGLPLMPGGVIDTAGNAIGQNRDHKNSY